MRTYVNSTEEAQRAVAEIVRLVSSKAVEPKIAFDVETAPIPGLEGYPGTVVDDNGEIVKPSKKSYLEFIQKVWLSSFRGEMLQAYSIFLPKKTTAGKENATQSASQAWAAFFEAVANITDSELEENCRITEDDYRAIREDAAYIDAECWHTVEALKAELPAEGVRGYKTALSKLKKAEQALADAEEWSNFVGGPMKARLDQPVDIRLLRHIVKQAQSSAIKTDPVRPGLDPHTSTLFLVQFSLRRPTGEIDSYIFNTHKVEVALLEPVFALKRVVFLGANIKFDLGHLMAKGLSAPENVECTRINSRMLYLGLKMSHSLAAVYERFCEKELSKEARATFVGRRYDEPTAEQLEYAYLDTEILFEISDAQQKMAEKNGQVALLDDFSNLSWITAKWETEGYPIDTVKWGEIALQAIAERDRLARELEQMLLPEGYAETFGLASVTEEIEEEEVDDSDDEDSDEGGPDTRPQAIIRISQTQVVCSLLPALLGQKVVDACPNGKPSLAKQAREMMERAYRERNGGDVHPFFLAYARWSKMAKQASTYGKGFLRYIHPLTGNVHPTFTIAGTDTARYTSTRPNLLNIPAAKEKGDPDFRGAFVAPKGKKLGGADYDGMEWRIGADMARDARVKLMTESGADGHTITAALMFHIKKNGVSEPKIVVEKFRRGTTVLDLPVYHVPQSWTDEQMIELATSKELAEIIAKVPEKITRQDAKAVTFLWLFQGTPFTLSQRTGLSMEQCDEFFKRFADTYKGVDSYMKELGDKCLSENVFEGNDGKLYAFCEGYNGIRRYVVLPHNPYRGDYRDDWSFYQAQKLYERLKKRARRELVNLVCQGGNAVITAKALRQMVKDGKRVGVYPHLAVYDEIIAVIDEKTPNELAKITVESAMLGAADEFMEFISAGAEVNVEKIGYYWRKS